MIDLYFCPTPNCQKVSIALEELGIDYQVIPIDIVAGDQNEPEFAALCPNRKVPLIVDPDGPGGERLVLWESGAILLYLARERRRSMAIRSSTTSARTPMAVLADELCRTDDGSAASLRAVRAGTARLPYRPLHPGS